MASNLTNDLISLAKGISQDRHRLFQMESGIVLRELPSLNAMISDYNHQMQLYQQQVALLPKSDACSRLFQKIRGEMQGLSSQVDGLRNKVLFSFSEGGPATRSMREKFGVIIETTEMMEAEFTSHKGIIPKGSWEAMGIYGAHAEIEIGVKGSFDLNLLKEVDAMLEHAKLFTY